MTHVSVFSPLDTVCVSKVMSLSSFFIVKQNDDGGDEVDDLSGWKEINVCSAVSAAVTIPAGSQGGTWETPGDPSFRLYHLELFYCSMQMTLILLLAVDPDGLSILYRIYCCC